MKVLGYDVMMQMPNRPNLFKADENLGRSFLSYVLSYIYLIKT